MAAAHITSLPPDYLPDYEKARLYEQYQPLIYKRAIYHSRKFGKPLEELVEEGRWALSLLICQDWGEFNPAKSSEMSWIYQRISWKMLDFCTRRRVDTHLSTLPHAEQSFVAPSHKDKLHEMMINLSREAQTLFRIILTAPGDLAQDLTPATKGRARLAVRAHVARKYGWPPAKVERVWNEVRDIVCT